MAGESFLVRLLDAQSLVAAILPVLHRRAQVSLSTGNFPLGLVVDDQRVGLVLSRKRARLERFKPVRDRLRVSGEDLTRLALGRLSAVAALAQGRLMASTRVASRLAALMFPPVGMWRPPLDELAE